MAWKGRKQADVDFANLLSPLIQAKLQTENPALYQTLKGLIEKVQQNKNQVNEILNSFFGDVEIGNATDLAAILIAISTINSILTGSTFWVALDESNNLPNSRMAVAGTGLSFDYSVPNRVTINATGGGGECYIPLGTGVEPLQFMSDGNGQPFLIPFVP